MLGSTSMRSGARKVRASFTAASLTHFGGIFLLHQFLQQVKLRTYLATMITYRERNNHYTLSELMLALIYPMILGLENIEVSALLKTNGVFQYLTGLPSFPDPTALRRFLIRSAPVLLPEFRAVHAALRARFLILPTVPSSIWLDCDSTVRTLFGHQEGAAVGYNPRYRGKRSYHPLVIREAHRDDLLGGLLRPGNVHTADGIQELIKDVLIILPRGIPVRLRADAGFYDGDLVRFLKENHISFVIVADCTGPIKRRIPGLRYQRISTELAVAEFRYQPHGWDTKERFVALRKKLPNDPVAPQGTLLTLNRYAYRVLVTNLPLTPYGVFQFYDDHAGVERVIRTLKDDYPFAKAVTNNFEANSLYAELSLFAYNLITWFKRLCLPEVWQSYTLPTIRHRLLLIPGEFTRSKNIPTLKFPRNNLYQDTFTFAQDRIKQLDPLI